MKRRFEKRFEEGLETIRASLQKKGGTKNYEKVLERIGRLKERTHGIHQYYEIELKKSGDMATDILYRYAKADEAEQRYMGPEVAFLEMGVFDLDFAEHSFDTKDKLGTN